jgi:hypothetical protein
MSHFSVSALLSLFVCLTSASASRSEDILVPDTTVASFRFSAMVLNTTVPALACIVTGPADMTATISILVLLFEKADSPDPYAKVGGNAAISNAGPRGNCNVNNGQQTVPPITPAKIEIQVSATTVVLGANVPVTLPPKKK